MSDTKDKAAEPKKKGGKMKWVLIGVGALVLAGGGVGGGLYATGVIGGGGDHAEAESDRPRLVPKSEQKHAGEDEGGEGGGESTPGGEGGEEYASNYYTLEKEFTSNLADSVHFIQVGVAVSTAYDDKVLTNLKTHEIAVRSSVLMALSETNEDQVFTAEGKQQLQKRLVKAINDTLKEKEGFGGIGNVYFTNFVVQ
ncbi:flagellar basal body-associated FliL family protein [Sphingomonas sp.]|uniref:flagellar basal body-associated FliL family protein n=1 Tax=Sphingomonas sp. TaxID=28214 RepID=UPI002B95B053|nr:flagellar basal body-associated FliL family protein [Sphingomonas sp.]HTG37583.1 flagellar basal body-associated FliL family protein [Sphingomonas sp.]